MWCQAYLLFSDWTQSLPCPCWHPLLKQEEYIFHQQVCWVQEMMKLEQYLAFWPLLPVFPKQSKIEFKKELYNWNFKTVLIFKQPKLHLPVRVVMCLCMDIWQSNGPLYKYDTVQSFVLSVYSKDLLLLVQGSGKKVNDN